MLSIFGRNWLCVALLLGSSLYSPVSAQEPSESALFDGSGTKGWKAERIKARVRDRILQVGPGVGWLRAEKIYADFVLTLEVRLTPGTNAGVVLRTWPTGLTPDGKRITNDFYRLSFRSETGDGGQPGWHRVEVRCVGNTIAVSIDGNTVQVPGGPASPQGYLGLWSENGVAEFRTVTVRPLSFPPPTPPPGVLLGNKVDQLPKVLRAVKPNYTAAALAAGIHGLVLLEAVVLADGTVDKIVVRQSLDPLYGLDREAVKAASQWRFQPAMHEGRQVAVLVTIELAFTIKK